MRVEGNRFPFGATKSMVKSKISVSEVVIHYIAYVLEIFVRNIFCQRTLNQLFESITDHAAAKDWSAVEVVPDINCDNTLVLMNKSHETSEIFFTIQLECLNCFKSKEGIMSIFNCAVKKSRVGVQSGVTTSIRVCGFWGKRW